MNKVYSLQENAKMIMNFRLSILLLIVAAAVGCQSNPAYQREIAILRGEIIDLETTYAGPEAKARAALNGSYMARLEDIEAVARPVLTHRVLTNFAAESQGMTAAKVVDRLVDEMKEA